MKQFLVLVLWILALALPAFAQNVTDEGGGSGSGISSGTSFPGSPSTNDLFLITDDSVAGACDSGAGSARTLCVWDGADWVAVNVLAESQDLNDVCANGCEITTAVSKATGQKTGDGTNYVSRYWDPSKGQMDEPEPLGDSPWRCWTNFNCIFRDEEANATILTIDPDAASKNAMYQFGTNYKPIASFYVPLSPRGAATMTEGTSGAHANQPKGWWGTLTDANTDGFDFHFPVTARMVGVTTFTVRLWGVSDNATPSGNIELDCAATSYRPGTDSYGAHSTTGEQAVVLTPATQHRPVSAVSSAITINGTVAENAEIIGSCEVDATNTTSAQLTDFFLRGEALIQFVVNSWSD